MFPNQRATGQIPGASNVQTTPAKIKTRAAKRRTSARPGPTLYGGGLGPRSTQEYGRKSPGFGRQPKQTTPEGLY